jgi:hypothetical protein
MADETHKPAAKAAAQTTPPPAPDATGAGTTAVEPITADPRDLEIAALKAQLIATSAASAVAANAAATNTVVPTAPAALDVPLVSKYDTLTKNVQSLPQATWNLLSDEDQKRFTPAGAEKPADLPTV